MRIDIAYCIELNQVVDIQKACEEFFCQQEFKEFHFLCSNPICRNSKRNGVRVRAINHNKLPEEHGVNPYFHKWDEHVSDCYWKELADVLEAEEVIDKD